MNFVTKEPINKGWSSDKKYCVTDENGTRYLLLTRIPETSALVLKKTVSVISPSLPVLLPRGFRLLDDDFFTKCFEGNTASIEWYCGLCWKSRI